MRATLYVFAYGGLTGVTHLCVARELRDWPQLVHGVVQDDALIDRSRSCAATHFLLDKDAGDVMLMVDHDIIWDAGDLRRLAEKCAYTKGIVAGIYSKRGFHAGQTFRIERPCRFRVGENRLVPATFVASGFMAIHREVVEHVAAQVPLVIQNFYPMFLPLVVETEHGMEHLSEDWAFCWRAKGKRIDIDTKPVLRHLGSYQYRMVDSLLEPPTQGLEVEITHNSATLIGRSDEHLRTVWQTGGEGREAGPILSDDPIASARARRGRGVSIATAGQ